MTVVTGDCQHAALHSVAKIRHSSLLSKSDVFAVQLCSTLTCLQQDSVGNLHNVASFSGNQQPPLNCCTNFHSKNVFMDRVCSVRNNQMFEMIGTMSMFAAFATLFSCQFKPVRCCHSSQQHQRTHCQSPRHSGVF